MTDELLGKKIGGYEITDVIGRGGMATVYRAYQVSMNRVVALKVLPRHLANDDTYLQRFHREVKIASQLEHRNIVPVHDYGEYEGQPYIVMRYLPGGSVDDLLKNGPLALEQIIELLDQIAPALDYAHGKGVLHRDLKPSNVLIDDNGGAYLTDFGIARILGETSSVVTTQGVVGTPSYMSPEQAQGHHLDNRSDIYSLGVALFEMATGQRPFEGDTPYGIAVLQVTAAPPQPRALNPNIPALVESVILTALSKKREQRYTTAVQMAQALEDAARAKVSLLDTQPGFPRPEALRTTEAQPANAASANPAHTPPPPPPSSASYPVAPAAQARRRLAPRRGGNLLMNIGLGAGIGCGLLIIIALIGAVIVSSILNSNIPVSPTPAIPGGLASPPPPTNTAAALTRGTATRRATATLTAVPPTAAPDVTQLNPVGQRDTPMPLTDGALVYFAERDGSFNIYRMDLRTREETALTRGTSNELYPAVSPDGARIAFMSDQDGDYDLYVMNADGSGVRRLTSNEINDRTPAWSPDGEWIVFASDVRGDGAHDLYRVRADGSDLSELYTSGDLNSAPQWSADGASILFTGGSRSDAATWEILRLDVASGDVMALTNNDVKDWGAIFAPDGSILYLTGGEGHAAVARMDADGGNAATLYDGAGYEWGVSVSPAGDLIAFTSDVSGRDEIYLMNADGTNVRPVTDLGGMGAWWLPR